MTYPPIHVLHYSGPTSGTEIAFPFNIFEITIPYHYPAHRHDFLEIFLVVQGAGYQVINGEKYPLHAGVLTFLLPYQIHELYANPQEPLQLINCMFGMDLLFPLSDHETGLNDLLLNKEELPSSIQLTGEDNNQIHNILRCILQEFRNQNPWRNQLLRLKLFEVIIYFNRLQLHHASQPFSYSAQSNKSIWPVVRYIHSHYREPLSLSLLAKQFDFNHTNLSTEFKKQLGLNFVHFLQEIRIRHACALLSTTNLSGVDIAIEVGFDSFRTFTRVFRELKGMTPKQYQNKYQAVNYMNSKVSQ